MLYIILVFVISSFIVMIDSTLWINVFEVMLSIFFTLIYKEMKSMKKISHGVCSCICVETNVIIKIEYTKINID